jgi:hypothetical protein
MVDAKPLLAVTLGDAAGTGPELITRAFSDPEVRAVCRPFVVGDAGTVRAALAITREPATVRVIGRPAEAGGDPAVIDVLDPRVIVGAHTGVEHLVRVRLRPNDAPHLIFHDRHGWYCESHGPTCHTVQLARDATR